MSGKYLSARKLKITEGERKYLIKAKNMLKDMKPNQAKKIDGLKLGFYMPSIIEERASNDTKHLCGAAGCIKGWMDTLAIEAGDCKAVGIEGVKPENLAHLISTNKYWIYGSDNNSEALDELFYPSDDVCEMDLVTPKIAAKAIDQFLRGKTINWGDASADNVWMKEYGIPIDEWEGGR